MNKFVVSIFILVGLSVGLSACGFHAGGSISLGGPEVTVVRPGGPLAHQTDQRHRSPVQSRGALNIISYPDSVVATFDELHRLPDYAVAAVPGEMCGIKTSASIGVPVILCWQDRTVARIQTWKQVKFTRSHLYGDLWIYRAVIVDEAGGSAHSHSYYGGGHHTHRGHVIPRRTEPSSPTSVYVTYKQWRDLPNAGAPCRTYTDQYGGQADLCLQISGKKPKGQQVLYFSSHYGQVNPETHTNVLSTRWQNGQQVSANPANYVRVGGITLHDRAQGNRRVITREVIRREFYLRN